VASVVAGGLWDRFGAAATFYAGSAFCTLTPGALAFDAGWNRQRARQARSVLCVSGCLRYSISSRFAVRLVLVLLFDCARELGDPECLRQYP